MNKLEKMLEYLGWQGGTIHDAKIAIENDLIAEEHNLWKMQNNISDFEGIDKAYYSPSMLIACRKRIAYIKELLLDE